MKREKPTARGEWNHLHYSVIQNTWYCIRFTARCYSPLLLWCVILIVVGAALPVLTTYLPKIVLEKLSVLCSLRELAGAISLLTIHSWQAYNIFIL